MFSRGGRGWRGAGRRLVAGIACVGLALVVAAGACGGDDDGDPDDTATSTSADTEPRQTTTTRFTPEEQEVVDAYLAFWDMAIRLAQNPNPDDPEIQQRASGEALGNLVDGLTTLRAANQVTEIGPKTGHDILSVSVDDGRATLEDCAVDDSRLLDAETRTEVDRGVTTTHWEVLLTSDNGDRGWIVEEFEQVDAWEEAVSCQ